MLNLRFLSLLTCALAVVALGQQQTDWPTYGGGAGAQRYSPAKQITPRNVKDLQLAWQYHAGLQDGRTESSVAMFEATPVLFRGQLLLSTPYNQVISLDAETGKQRWKFDPHLSLVGGWPASRGVSVWDSGRATPGVCESRVVEGTADGSLLELDAATGALCQDFGNHGFVNLKTAEIDYRKGDIISVTSPPAIVGDVIVVGSLIADNVRVDVPRGDVRGYDVRTGRQLWSWNPLPWADKQKLRTGGGNAWSAITADPKLGLVYVPTGSPAPDYYGGMRPGNNADADSVVALDGKTGQRVWGFQLVHHDLWDYDVASQPLLFDYRGTPALAATNKTGMVYVLDRRTGKPLIPAEERPVPKSDVPGELASPTQPFSALPRLLPETPFTTDTPQVDVGAKHTEQCAARIAALRYEGPFTPPSLQGTLQYPGKLGGPNWGSMAFDPETGVLYANNNRAPYQISLVPRDKEAPSADGQMAVLLRSKNELIAGSLVLLSGLVLFWPARTRRVAAPLLLVVGVVGVVHAAIRYRYGSVERSYIALRGLHVLLGVDNSLQEGTPYKIHLMPVADTAGLPCGAQPWGALTALDVEHGALRWQKPLGTLVAGKHTGSVELGGPIVTAGGLIFSAGGRDPYLHGFDKSTGDELWTQRLPVPAQATPMTYTLNGRQFVVIVDGGHGTFGTELGDSVLAYALPQGSAAPTAP